MRKHFLNIPFLVAFACLAASAASAQVIINEFSASNYTLGVNGDNEDYIEFYNQGPTAVDLDGHWLSDNRQSPDVRNPSGTTIAAGGYLLIICSMRGSSREPLHRWELEYQLQGDANDGGVGGVLSPPVTSSNRTPSTKIGHQHKPTTAGLVTRTVSGSMARVHNPFGQSQRR